VPRSSSSPTPRPLIRAPVEYVLLLLGRQRWLSLGDAAGADVSDDLPIVLNGLGLSGLLLLSVGLDHRPEPCPCCGAVVVGELRRPRLVVPTIAADLGFFAGIKVRPPRPGNIKTAINDAGWLEDHVIAAGHLRQGRAAAWSAVYWFLPAPSKKLPRHFVLALTASEVVAFRATETGGDPDSAYNRLKIREGVRFRYPRESVSLTDLPEGAASAGGTITIDGESFAVMRPNRYGDPNTDELIAVLAGVPAVTWPR
jgi:hypothetical protein